MKTPQHSPKREYPELPKVVEVYLDGLDASIDGRGWGLKHEKAKNYIFKAVNAHEALVAVLKRQKADGVIDENEIDAALKLAGEK